MDKYEYKVRAEEIKSLIEERKYPEAMAIADTIDWRKVKSVSMLCDISDLYSVNRKFDVARDVLELAYERHPEGRRIVYSLCELSIKMQDVIHAVEYYKEFSKIAPKDSGRYILQYKIYEAQEVSIEERISVLEELKKRDYREKWAYELAYLYHRAGLATQCVEECDELILWFGEGVYVKKAMELKMLHTTLTAAQNEKYAQMTGVRKAPEKQKRKKTEMENGSFGQSYTEANEEPEIRVKPVDTSLYNTMNLQKELAQNLEAVLAADRQEPEEVVAVHGQDTTAFDPNFLSPYGNDQQSYPGQSYYREEYDRQQSGDAYAPQADTGAFYGTDTNPYAQGQPQEYDNTGYQNTSYENTGYENPGYGNTGYENSEYQNPGYDTAGYDNAGYQNPGYDTSDYGNNNIDNTGYANNIGYEGNTYDTRQYPDQSYYGYESMETGYDTSVEEEPQQIYPDQNYYGQPQWDMTEVENPRILPQNLEPLNRSIRDLEDIKIDSVPDRSIQKEEVTNGQDKAGAEYAELLSQEDDGQISLFKPEEPDTKPAAGELSMDDVMAEWERMKRENEQKHQEEVRNHVLIHTGNLPKESELEDFTQSAQEVEASKDLVKDSGVEEYKFEETEYPAEEYAKESEFESIAPLEEDLEEIVPMDGEFEEEAFGGEDLEEIVPMDGEFEEAVFSKEMPEETTSDNAEYTEAALTEDQTPVTEAESFVDTVSEEMEPEESKDAKPRPYGANRFDLEDMEEAGTSDTFEEAQPEKPVKRVVQDYNVLLYGKEFADVAASIKEPVKKYIQPEYAGYETETDEETTTAADQASEETTAETTDEIENEETYVVPDQPEEESQPESAKEVSEEYFDMSQLMEEPEMMEEPVENDIKEQDSNVYNENDMFLQEEIEETPDESTSQSMEEMGEEEALDVSEWIEQDTDSEPQKQESEVFAPTAFVEESTDSDVAEVKEEVSEKIESAGEQEEISIQEQESLAEEVSQDAKEDYEKRLERLTSELIGQGGMYEGTSEDAYRIDTFTANPMEETSLYVSPEKEQVLQQELSNAEVEAEKDNSDFENVQQSESEEQPQEAAKDEVADTFEQSAPQMEPQYSEYVLQDREVEPAKDMTGTDFIEKALEKQLMSVKPAAWPQTDEFVSGDYPQDTYMTTPTAMEQQLQASEPEMSQPQAPQPQTAEEFENPYRPDSFDQQLDSFESKPKDSNMGGFSNLGDEEQPVSTYYERQAAMAGMTKNVRRFTTQEEELFTPFLRTRKAKEQLIYAIDNISMASYTGNIIITGENQNENIELAKNLIREVQMNDDNFSGNLGKITAESLNKKDVEAVLQKVANGAVIIEGAGDLSRDTVNDIVGCLEQENRGIILILVDQKIAIDKMLSSNPIIRNNFNARIDIEEMTTQELQAYGKTYAYDKEYAIDDMGMLELFSKIDDLQTNGHAVMPEEVEQIIDNAIKKANKATIKHFTDVILNKRYDEEDMIVLRAKDFA